MVEFTANTLQCPKTRSQRVVADGQPVDLREIGFGFRYHIGCCNNPPMDAFKLILVSPTDWMNTASSST